MPKQNRHLATVLLAVLVLVAGCAGSTGDNDPTSTPTPPPTATPTPVPTTTATPPPTTTTASSATIEALIEATLVSEGLTVESVETDGRTGRIAYTTYQTTENGLAREIGAVAGTFAGAVDLGWEVDRLEVEVRGATGEPIGWFSIERDWAVAYNEGAISIDEYSLRVLGTLETAE